MRLTRLAGLALVAAACSTPQDPPCESDCADARLEPLFATESLGGCILASPRALADGRVLVATQDGRLAALEPTTGAVTWDTRVPTVAPRVADLAATPALVGKHALVAWQDANAAGTRVAQRVAVLDLDAHAFDTATYPPLSLEAEKPASDGDGAVEFLPSNSYSRTPVLHVPGAGGGRAYVSFGNIRDIQPWHGWVFELDLAAWAGNRLADAVSGVLLTTSQSRCGPAGESGSDDMICGGGVWSPSGLQLAGTAEAPEILIPTGNGRLAIPSRDYANGILRARPGLAFEPGCDAEACADFDPLSPSEACLASCRDLFAPRLVPHRSDFTLPKPCAGQTFMECYATLDWDLGANTPELVTLPGGRRVQLLPAKDGGVYLFDHDHFGRLYDRVQAAPVCGENGSTCNANWAGMFVTRPVVVADAQGPIVLVHSFQYDATQPAGVIAFRIDGADEPRLRRLWQWPDPASSEAVERFRQHPGRIAAVTRDGVPLVLVLDVAGNGQQGTLLLLDARNGRLVQEQALRGRGRRFVEPLVTADAVYVTSCDGRPERGTVEAFRLK